MVESERIEGDPGGARGHAFQKIFQADEERAEPAGELCQVWARRTKFWKSLGRDTVNKVKIYSYRGIPESPYLMHSKVFRRSFVPRWVSSANCNRRSYSHDSEIGSGVARLHRRSKGKRRSRKTAGEALAQTFKSERANTDSRRRRRFQEIQGAVLWDTPNTALEPLDDIGPSNQPPDQHVSKYLPAQATFELPSLSLFVVLRSQVLR